MGVFYKKCEVCGENIPKFHSKKESFYKMMLDKLECQKCKTSYKTSKISKFILEVVSYIFPAIVVAVVYVLYMYLPDYAVKTLGFWIFPIGFVIALIFLFILELFLRLYVKDKNNKKDNL